MTSSVAGKYRKEFLIESRAVNKRPCLYNIVLGPVDLLRLQGSVRPHRMLYDMRRWLARAGQLTCIDKLWQVEILNA